MAKLSVQSATQHVVRKWRESRPVAETIRNNPRKVGTPKNTVTKFGNPATKFDEFSAPSLC